MTVNCNRIAVKDDILGIVKDTCDGCKINPKTCALNDMFADIGLLKNWEKWEMPNFRERVSESEVVKSE